MVAPSQPPSLREQISRTISQQSQIKVTHDSTGRQYEHVCNADEVADSVLALPPLTRLIEAARPFAEHQIPVTNDCRPSASLPPDNALMKVNCTMGQLRALAAALAEVEGEEIK